MANMLIAAAPIRAIPGARSPLLVPVIRHPLMDKSPVRVETGRAAGKRARRVRGRGAGEVRKDDGNAGQKGAADAGGGDRRLQSPVPQSPPAPDQGGGPDRRSEGRPLYLLRSLFQRGRGVAGGAPPPLRPPGRRGGGPGRGGGDALADGAFLGEPAARAGPLRQSA